jgi:hypothetical protein
LQRGREPLNSNLTEALYHVQKAKWYLDQLPIKTFDKRKLGLARDANNLCLKKIEEMDDFFKRKNAS